VASICDLGPPNSSRERGLSSRSDVIAVDGAAFGILQDAEIFPFAVSH